MWPKKLSHHTLSILTGRKKTSFSHLCISVIPYPIGTKFATEFPASQGSLHIALILLCTIRKSILFMLEVTCPLDSVHHLRNRKQLKFEYLQILAEFGRLNISSYYETIEISILGHYQQASIGNYLILISSNFPTLP